MSDHPNIHKRRIRLLYSLKDIQLALSAADFLQECDPDTKTSKVELRRYKCFETTAIVAYARPFSESRGGFPKLSLKMIGVQLDHNSKVLHDEILDLRNRVVAHSDSDMMRMVVRRHEVNLGNGETMPYVRPVFDEGLDFVGFSSVSRLLMLFHTVYEGLYSTILEDVRSNPDKFDFRHDFLDQDSN
jgi:hypothetical protein